MTKAQGKVSQTKDADSPPKESTDKKSKDKGRHDSEEDALFGRVKKVIKKSRRKLSEEKFEKELQRTIAFLKDLQSKLVGSNNSTNSVDESEKRKRTRVVKQAKPRAAGKKKKASAAGVKRPLTASAKTNE